MQVCLVKCPSPFLIDEKVFPPLGLLAVGTVLKQAGHGVYVHDGSLEDIPRNYSYYGFGPSTPEYPYAVRAMRAIRQHNKSARIVIGGPHATLNPISDEFDCVVLGDGEPVAEEAFRGNQVIMRGDERPLDEYPIVDRNLIDIRAYKYQINNRQATSVVTARGCPYRCGFCCKNYKTVRLRSADSVKREIEILDKDFGYRAFMFFDDTFILNKQRVVDLCKYFKTHDVLWRCFVRGDLVVRHGAPLIEKMADSGCVEVGIGIESASDRILKTIHKGESIDTIRKAIGILRKNAIRVKGLFIIGLPGENYESLGETEGFLHEVELDDADFTIFQPYAGAPIWEHKAQYDIDWHELEYLNTWYKGFPDKYMSNVFTSELSPIEIVSAREALYQTWRKL